MNSLAKVPMRFLEEGAVLLRAEQAPLLCEKWIREGFRDRRYCVFRCLETWTRVTLGADVIVDGCERRGWEILKRSHPATPSGSVDSDHSNHEGCETRTPQS